MPVELRKRAAPPAPLPPAKKKAPAKPKAKKEEPEAPKPEVAAAEIAPAKSKAKKNAPKVSAPKASEPKEAAPVVAPVEDAPAETAAAPAPVEPAPAEVAPTAPAPAETAPTEAAPAQAAPEPSKGGAPKVGESISLQGFGGEIETNDGEKTTLAKLVASSKAGVVLFTYPAANTPGCTKQACLFRDAHDPLTATGFSIYGLSKDSPKSNTTFKTKQKLQYPLLCDPSLTLINAIGMKKAKSTTRGVFVIDKSGKVLAAEPGGPEPTVNVVKKLVAAMGGNSAAEGIKKAEGLANKDAADTAAEVADSAQKIDA